MKRLYATPIALGVVLLLGAVTGCFDPFSYGPRSGGGSIPDELAFEGNIYPVLLSYCSVCHSEGGAADGTAFVLSNEASADYDMVVSFVTQGDPDNSTLLQKAAGSISHGGSNVLAETSIEYQTLAAWVEQGAAQ